MFTGGRHGDHPCSTVDDVFTESNQIVSRGEAVEQAAEALAAVYARLDTTTAPAEAKAAV